MQWDPTTAGTSAGECTQTLVDIGWEEALIADAPSHLITPHGGRLVELIVGYERAEELRAQSRDWASWTLSPRQVCDLELLMNGGFSPLTGFMCGQDYDSVCEHGRLADGTLWPVPIVLDVPKDVASDLQPGSTLALRDLEGVMLAVLHVEEVWQPDLERECRAVYGTTDPDHPGVACLLRAADCHNVGGTVEGVQLPVRYDFRSLRLTPAALRQEFTSRGWRRVIAFQTRKPMHRAHCEATLRAAKDTEASLLIHPLVGPTNPQDVNHYTRVRCYQSILRHYPHNTCMLSLLPLAMRMAGPRETVLHALVSKNYGCTHCLVGRDHAGAGSDSQGRLFYDPSEAQRGLREVQDELGVSMVELANMVYLPDDDDYVPEEEAPRSAPRNALSDDELFERLAQDREIPPWHSFPEVIDELRKAYPPRTRQGFTVFFTGLPSSGKSTLAGAVRVRLLEMGGRPVTLLDGDVVRRHLSSELGFSKEHRDLNIRRIGFVASEITKNGGIALCAPIAPYDRVRQDVRAMVAPGGGFILVHVATPVEVCESRDRKGLYAKARAGLVKEFTGVSDPYEAPEDADVVLDTTSLTPEEGAQEILLFLERRGYIGPNGSHREGTRVGR